MNVFTLFQFFVFCDVYTVWGQGLELLPFGEAAGDVDTTTNGLYVKCVDVSAFNPDLGEHGTPINFLGRSDNFLCASYFLGAISLGSGEIGAWEGKTHCERSLTHYSIMPFLNYFESNIDGGSVTHRVTKDQEIMSAVVDIISPAFPNTDDFKLELWWSYIATYNNKSTYASNTLPKCASPRNSFQVIVAGGPVQSFVIFMFQKIQWTSPPDGCSVSPIGSAVESAVGFMNNHGSYPDTYYVHYLPGSCSSDVANLVKLSNVGKPGVWVFRTDLKKIVESNEEFLEPSDEICRRPAKVPEGDLVCRSPNPTPVPEDQPSCPAPVPVPDDGDECRRPTPTA